MVYRWRLLVQTIRILTAGRPRDFIFNPWHIGAADTLKFWNHQIPAIVYQNWYTIMMACSFTLPIQPFPRECSAIYVHPMPWKSEKNCLYHSKPYQSGDNHPLLWLYYAIYILYTIQILVHIRLYHDQLWSVNLIFNHWPTHCSNNGIQCAITAITGYGPKLCYHAFLTEKSDSCDLFSGASSPVAFSDTPFFLRQTQDTMLLVVLYIIIYIIVYITVHTYIYMNNYI